MREAHVAVDFTLAPEHEAIRGRVHTVIPETVQPPLEDLDDESRVMSRGVVL